MSCVEDVPCFQVQDCWLQLEKAFKSIDRDGSGAIDRAEMKQVSHIWGLGLGLGLGSGSGLG